MKLQFPVWWTRIVYGDQKILFRAGEAEKTLDPKFRDIFPFKIPPKSVQGQYSIFSIIHPIYPSFVIFENYVPTWHPYAFCVK